MTDSSILVTGATGFVGKAVCRRLVGRALLATDLRADPAAVLSAFRSVDLVRATPDELLVLCKGVTQVVHVAGIFDLEANRRLLNDVNVRAAEKMARAAAKAGCKKFVHISSASIFGNPRGGTAQEDARPRPSNNYERSKWQGEKRIRSVASRSGMALTILRPAGVYGADSRYSFAMLVGMYAAGSCQGSRLKLFRLKNTPSLSVISADRLADAVAFCLDHPETDGQTYTLAEPEAWNWGDTVNALIRWYGVHPSGTLDLGSLRGKALLEVYRFLPSFLRDKINRAMAHEWRRYQKAYKLKDDFCPRFDRHSMDYWRSDHMYRSTKLVAQGWKCDFGTARQNLRELVEAMAQQGIVSAPES